jgi:hypothetical protein
MNRCEGDDVQFRLVPSIKTFVQQWFTQYRTAWLLEADETEVVISGSARRFKIGGEVD